MVTARGNLKVVIPVEREIDKCQERSGLLDSTLRRVASSKKLKKRMGILWGTTKRTDAG